MEKSQQRHAGQLSQVAESIRSTDFSGKSETELNLTNAPVTAIEKLKKAQSQHTTQKRWGYVLVALGVITILDAVSPIPIPLVGSPALVLGSILTVLGYALTIAPARMRQTNEAMLVGMKNGNRLTVPLLALEMDVSLDKAEKIIAQLVKRGIAEIDLDVTEPDAGITYKLRGL